MSDRTATPKTNSPARRRRSRATGRVRIEEVARVAVVSAQTVSRFLRDPTCVTANTAERIRTAIDRTGYVPNLVAGSLASNRSNVVAIIVPMLTARMSWMARSAAAMLGRRNRIAESSP